MNIYVVILQTSTQAQAAKKYKDLLLSTINMIKYITDTYFKK